VQQRGCCRKLWILFGGYESYQPPEVERWGSMEKDLPERVIVPVSGSGQPEPETTPYLRYKPEGELDFKKIAKISNKTL